jgi:hypothetical protein
LETANIIGVGGLAMVVIALVQMMLNLLKSLTANQQKALADIKKLQEDNLNYSLRIARVIDAYNTLFKKHNNLLKEYTALKNRHTEIQKLYNELSQEAVTKNGQKP